jgi:hypothetical protein
VNGFKDVGWVLGRYLGIYVPGSLHFFNIIRYFLNIYLLLKFSVPSELNSLKTIQYFFLLILSIFC